MKITCEPMRNYVITMELSKEDAETILSDFIKNITHSEPTAQLIKELKRVAGIGYRGNTETHYSRSIHDPDATTIITLDPTTRITPNTSLPIDPATSI